MTSMKNDVYDLLILGSGSTAFAAAIHAQDLGKTAVMTEGRTLGGTCVNRGCLPSKNLIEAARLVYDAAHPRYPGLTPARLSVDFPALIAQKDEVIREYRDQHYASLLDDANETGQPPIEVVPRAGAIRDTRGVIKMVLDRPTGRVVGVSMLGVNAGEVIHEAAMALRFGATTDDFIDLIHVYPTMAEALKLVAISFTKDVNRLSCCAS